MKTSFYDLTNFCGLWWDGEREQWGKSNRVRRNKNSHYELSTHRNLGKDAKAAWKIFRSCPDGFILMRWVRVNGKRGVFEWEMKDGKVVPFISGQKKNS